VELWEGIPDGNFDSKAPKLQGMVGNGREGEPEQRDGPGAPFCGVFHPISYRGIALLAMKLGFTMYGCWSRKYGL